MSLFVIIRRVRQSLRRSWERDIQQLHPYMAPEVADGNPAEPGSDLYSVGCLLYETVTGSRVFASSDPVAEIEDNLTR